MQPALTLGGGRLVNRARIMLIVSEHSGYANLGIGEAPPFEQSLLDGVLSDLIEASPDLVVFDLRPVRPGFDWKAYFLMDSRFGEHLKTHYSPLSQINVRSETSLEGLLYPLNQEYIGLELWERNAEPARTVP